MSRPCARVDASLGALLHARAALEHWGVLEASQQRRPEVHLRHRLSVGHKERLCIRDQGSTRGANWANKGPCAVYGTACTPPYLAGHLGHVACIGGIESLQSAHCRVHHVAHVGGIHHVAVCVCGGASVEAGSISGSHGEALCCATPVRTGRCRRHQTVAEPGLSSAVKWRVQYVESEAQTHPQRRPWRLPKPAEALAPTLARVASCVTSPDRGPNTPCTRKLAVRKPEATHVVSSQKRRRTEAAIPATRRRRRGHRR